MASFINKKPPKPKKTQTPKTINQNQQKTPNKPTIINLELFLFLFLPS